MSPAPGDLTLSPSPLGLGCTERGARKGGLELSPAFELNTPAPEFLSPLCTQTSAVPKEYRQLTPLQNSG